jgi:predicted aldo/keto reductase-like oxidoreductase
MGPLQLNLPLKEGVELILYAVNRGINFIDTAFIYGTYKYIKPVLKKARRKIYLASKTLAETYQQAEKEIKLTLRSLGLDRIDIFLLHAPRLSNPFEVKQPAWQCLKDYKERGIIKAIGLSSHSVKAIREAIKVEGVDIIHPLTNHSGLGILDGGREEMEEVIKKASSRGIGVYVMKSLGGGNLIDGKNQAFLYVLSFSSVDSIMVGMVRKKEVDYNLKFFEARKVPAKLEQATQKQTKRITIIPFCRKCGECIKRCPNQALIMGKNKPYVRRKRCILCGYCASKCSEFVIRLA